MACRIGIIGDGPTDSKVIGRLAECIVSYGHSKTPQIIELRRQNIRDAVDRYWRDTSKSNNYQIRGEAGKRLQGQVFAMLRTAVEEFRTLAKCDNLSWNDLVVLSTDAERHFGSTDTYFEDWAFHLPKILMAAIEQLYHQLIQRGYEWNYIPTIVPLPLYPSTDIIIAAAKNSSRSFHNLPARELKKLLYTVSDLNLLSPEEFDRQALDHLTEDSLGRIFRYIPEVRFCIHMMLWRGSNADSVQ